MAQQDLLSIVMDGKKIPFSLQMQLGCFGLLVLLLLVFYSFSI
jgi:hypothetical protein